MDSDITYSAWYRLDSAITGSDRYFVMETNAENTWGPISYGLREDNGVDKGQVYTRDTAGDSRNFFVNNGNSQGAESGVWYNILVTYDADLNGGTYTAFLNGQAAGTMENFATIEGGNGVVIGGHRNGGGRNFDGLIDDVAIWNRVLNTDEIAYLQNNAVTPVPEPAQFALLCGLGGLLICLVRRRRAVAKPLLPFSGRPFGR